MKIRNQKRKKDLDIKRKARANKIVKPSFRYVMKVAYDGSNYGGYAKQKHKNTIQNRLEEALENVFGYYVKTTESSRTDAKVHALSQLVMFDLNEEISVNKIQSSLNEKLSKDIIIVEIKQAANDFHCRYDVVSKTYEYIISKKIDPRKNNYAWYIKDELDIKKMIDASQYLIGRHDFSSYKSAKATSENSIRTINYIDIVDMDDEIIIKINADGFLYNMVRLIVKALVDVGLEKKQVNYLKDILDLKKKPDNLESAPATGLTLIEILF